MSPLGISALGIKINVTGLSESEATFFSEQWKCCITEVHVDSQLSIARKPILWAKAFEHLTQQVTRQSIEANLGKLMMFHASGLQFVGSDDVVGFVAPSGTGKSTLTSMLARSMVYVSDEVVAVDQKLAVSPLQKPISLIGHSDGSYKGHLGPQTLGLLTELSTSPRLKSLIVLNRVAERQEPEIRPLPLELALMSLVPQVSGLGLFPSGLNALCQVIQQLGGVLELTYSDAADLTAGYLARSIQTHQNALPTVWSHVQKTDASPTVQKFRITQSNNYDAVEVNGHVLVLDRGQIRMLGELASAVWLDLPTTSSKAELLENLETRFGAHKDSEKILERVLADLSLQELITDERR